MSERRNIKEVKPEKKRPVGLILILLLLFALIILVNIRVTNITVKGNKFYEDEVLTETVLPDGWGRNPLVILIKGIFTENKSIPFISSYKVRLNGLDSCEITVYEKVPLGYFGYMSSYMYFDKDGVIIESSDKRLEDIPEITGLKFGKVVLGQKLDANSVNLYEEIMNVVQQLSTYGIKCIRIDFDEKRNAVLYLGNGDIKVKIGNDDYLDAKLSALGDIYEQVVGLGVKGTVDLSNFKDGNLNGIVFTPDAEKSE